MKLIFTFFISFFSSRSFLARRILILEKENQILKRSIKKPKIKNHDRLFFVFLYRLWNNVKNYTTIVQPDTIVRWHKLGFKIYWKYKSRSKKPGKPKTDWKIIKLIRKMAKQNPTWGAPRIHSELLMLGHKIAESTVSNYMPKNRQPPSQTWLTFIKNHLPDTCAIDFFTVHTAGYKILYVFIIIHHETRKILHYNVTANPSAKWVSIQLKNAFPWETAPKYIIRDNDSIFSTELKKLITDMGINDTPTSFKSPWQNAYCERIIGSIRRDCLDHFIIWDEDHLRTTLSDYFDYYHNDRTHLGLDKKTPNKRLVQKKPSQDAKIINFPRLNGLHHRYEWKQAA